MRTIILIIAIATCGVWSAAQQVSSARSELAPVSVSDSLHEAQADSTHHRTYYLKTNALGYGLLIANIAGEMDIRDHWSFNFPIYYSALNYFSPRVKFRTFTVQPEMRYWLQADSAYHTGWWVGAHLGVGFFNVAYSRNALRYQDYKGHTPAFGGGIGAGYRMPLGREHRWMLEFAVGFGAYALHYSRFRNEDNGFLVDTKRHGYVGPDNVAVNIVYRFGHNRRHDDNREKGGQR